MLEAPPLGGALLGTDSCPPHPGIGPGLLLGGEDISALPQEGGSKDAPLSRQATLPQRRPPTLTQRHFESQGIISQHSGTSFKAKDTLLFLKLIAWTQPSTVQQHSRSLLPLT